MVKRLRAWRKKNQLSQRGLVEVMESRGVPIDITTVQQWEQGRHWPSGLAGRLVLDFLARYEKEELTDGPDYRKRSKLGQEDLAEIRRLREEGQTMKAIGERFGVSESYISHILSGDRLSRICERSRHGATTNH